MDLAAIGLVVATLVGSGGIGAILLFGPRRDSIIAAASEKAVATVAAVSDSLSEQLTQARERIAVLEDQNRKLNAEVASLKELLRDALVESREAVRQAEIEVRAQQVERERVQERDRQIDDAS